jgi:hypothetical protein
MTAGTRETFRARCSACHKIWDLDDNLEPIRLFPAAAWIALIVAGFLVAALVDLPL